MTIGTGLFGRSWWQRSRYRPLAALPEPVLVPEPELVPELVPEPEPELVPEPELGSQ